MHQDKSEYSTEGVHDAQQMALLVNDQYTVDLVLIKDMVDLDDPGIGSDVVHKS